MSFLQIYDASDASICASIRIRGGGDDRTSKGVVSATEMVEVLDDFVQKGQVFKRILIETHGSPGRIFFKGLSIDAAWINAYLPGRGYEGLCANGARIYFNGCNIAAGSSGTNFMQAIAGVFLKKLGGSVFAHTSYGYFLPVYTVFTGKVVHLTGDLKTIYVAAGGRITETSVQSDI